MDALRLKHSVRASSVLLSVLGVPFQAHGVHSNLQTQLIRLILEALAGGPPSRAAVAGLAEAPPRVKE